MSDLERGPRELAFLSGVVAGLKNTEGAGDEVYFRQAVIRCLAGIGVELAALNDTLTMAENHIAFVIDETRQAVGDVVAAINRIKG